MTRRKRLKKYEEGKKLVAEGRKQEALQMFTQSLSVTKEMIRQFILLLIRLKVPYIIAPYEADAEIAFLSRTGIVDAVISEDSDTLCYRCPCAIFKLNDNGSCKTVNLSELFSSPAMRMTNWNCDLFELMCVLSGCDYLSNLPKVGLKTAKKYIDNGKTMKGALQLIQVNPIHKWTSEYGKKLNEALACFHHQIIFNPLSNEMEYLTPLTPEEETTYSHMDSCPFGVLHDIDGGYGISSVPERQLISSDADLSYIHKFFLKRKLSSVPSCCRILPKRSDLYSTPIKDVSFSRRETASHKRNCFASSEPDLKRCYTCSPTSVIPRESQEDVMIPRESQEDVVIPRESQEDVMIPRESQEDVVIPKDTPPEEEFDADFFAELERLEQQSSRVC